MGKILNKDSHISGVIIGLILPILGFFGSYLIILLVDAITKTNLIQNYFAFQLVGIACNLWPMRYYFIKKQFELTGRGLLLVTFIYVLVFFWTQQF